MMATTPSRTRCRRRFDGATGLLSERLLTALDAAEAEGGTYAGASRPRWSSCRPTASRGGGPSTCASRTTTRRSTSCAGCSRSSARTTWRAPATSCWPHGTPGRRRRALSQGRRARPGHRRAAVLVGPRDRPGRRPPGRRREGPAGDRAQPELARPARAPHARVAPGGEAVRDPLALASSSLGVRARSRRRAPSAPGDPAS